jgi:hypothetical protein
MLLRNSKTIIIIITIKVKADKPQRKQEEDRPVVPAGVTLNRFNNAQVTESKYQVRSHRRSSVPRPTAD